MRFTASEIQQLNHRFESQPAEGILRWGWNRFGARAAIGTSFQGAGIVMMHLSQQAGLPFPFFTLDTGLLFPETLELKKRLELFFNISIESLTPETTVDEQTRIHGPELWKRAPDSCCWMRKVEPLQKKMESLDCWITGLRRQQSETRVKTAIMELYEFDSIRNREIVKLNPMAKWSSKAVWDYIRRHNLPYNPLHDRGYRSIGCAPCTRRSVAGEGERAGRWIGFNKTECGIHTFMKKKGEEGKEGRRA